MTLSEYLFVLRREVERLDTFGFAETIDFSEEPMTVAPGLQEKLVKWKKPLDLSCLIH